MSDGGSADGAPGDGTGVVTLVVGVGSNMAGIGVTSVIPSFALSSRIDTHYTTLVLAGVPSSPYPPHMDIPIVGFASPVVPGVYSLFVEAWSGSPVEGVGVLMARSSVPFIVYS